MIKRILASQLETALLPSLMNFWSGESPLWAAAWDKEKDVPLWMKKLSGICDVSLSNTWKWEDHQARVLAGPEGQTEWSCCEKDASSAAFCYPVETTGRTSGRFDIDIITRVYSICPTAVCSALNSCMVIVIMLLQVHVPYSVQLCSFKMIEWQACYGGQFAWSHAV